LISQIGLRAQLNVNCNLLPVTLRQYLDNYDGPCRLLTVSDIFNKDFAWERSLGSIPTLGFSDSAHWFSIDVTSDDLIQFFTVGGD
jgi:hypothetical protein